MREFLALVTADRTTPGARFLSTEPNGWSLSLFVAVIGLAMFAIALSGFPNLMDNERRIGAYVLDAVQHGHWIMQRDVTGEIASKPPLLTWLASLSTLAFGELNRFSVYLPSALATIGVALLLLVAGKCHFGWTAGFLAAVVYLLSPSGDRQMMTARYDGLLSLPVTLAALGAFRAWGLGRSWSWFWLAGALGILAKGPIAVLLGGAGLLAHFWEKHTRHESTVRGSHWPGVGMLLLICGGWFYLAYAEMGPPFLDKLLARELSAHATGAGRTDAMFMGFYEPLLAFLRNFAPWCVPALVAFWRVWKHPAEDDGERRFERFLFCWFFVGLVLFSIAAHQRGRLIFPLLPAAALLAGRELAWWLRGWSSPRLLKTAGAFAAVVLGLLFLYHHVLLAGSSRVQTTLGLRGVADRLDETLGAQFPVVYVDTPFALQFWLNTARPLVSFSNAAARLEANEPVIVAVSDFPKLEGLLATNQIVLHELARWPRHGTPVVRVVSNRPIPEARPRPAGPERAPHCCDEPRRSCAHNAIAPSSPAR